MTSEQQRKDYADAVSHYCAHQTAVKQLLDFFEKIRQSLENPFNFIESAERVFSTSSDDEDFLKLFLGTTPGTSVLSIPNVGNETDKKALSDYAALRQMAVEINKKLDKIADIVTKELHKVDPDYDQAKTAFKAAPKKVIYEIASKSSLQEKHETIRRDMFSEHLQTRKDSHEIAARIYKDIEDVCEAIKTFKGACNLLNVVLGQACELASYNHRDAQPCLDAFITSCIR